MATKLFIMGLPGSGKSALARYIVDHFEKLTLTVSRHNDYTILKEMFEYDSDKQFEQAEVEGGFDVHDWTAFDIALKRLEEVVNEHINSTPNDDLVIIEFSRNNYRLAFSLFRKEFLSDAYFLHLDTDVGICKARVLERANNPVYKDDYPVSDYIFEKYYHSDDGKKLPFTLKEYNEDGLHVLTLPNNGTFESITPQIDKFVQRFCRENITKEPALSHP